MDSSGNGYTIVQAKFRQRPEGVKSDGDWAIAELKKELKDFADRKKKRRTPQYYIFVTNVVLTPAGKKGSKDRIAKVFADFKKRVPIRGFRIWDYDQLRTHLDGSEDVRRSYLPFITAGDVLAEAMQTMMNARPDFEEVMASYLANELKSTQFANLERSGEQKILLARVFVDLPSSTEPSIEPRAEDAETPSKPGIVARFVSLASERLDPKSQLDTLQRQVDDGPPEAGRYVLVGGPGQGKTTAGQFVCQLFRTAILRGRPAHLVAAEVREAMAKIEELCGTEHIELPRAKRFPIQVTLSEFAAALSKRAQAVKEGQPGATALTLLSFVADKIRQRTGRDLSVDDLRRWFSAYAWLLVLDGLDEVPTSSNRNEVLASVEQFWIDMAQANSDILVLATTRPQDYRGDFSPRHYHHEWLTALSPPRALAYAQRLVHEKYAPNQDRCERVMHRLERAAAEENTGRLMRTPLQVTIMTTLLDQIGSPPQDRWRLFGEYYQAIYRREMERDTQKELLSRHRSDINIIHYRVGLELQVLSESAGRTDARLTTEQFKAIVRYRLKDEMGHEGLALEDLQKEIVNLAANRLVFLVGLDADSVGFEIRSLQEFMAAEALMSSATTLAVQNRLRVIAPIASWRNVFIFAAGRCFAQDEHLIDTIHTICSELNADLAGERGRIIRAGSQIAIDLLEDGSVNTKPRDLKILMRIALEIVNLPPAEAHRRMADLYRHDFELLYQELLREVLTRTSFNDRLGGWALVVILAGRDSDWMAFADEYWPDQIEQQVTIAKIRAVSPWIDNKILRLLPSTPFGRAATLFRMDTLPAREALPAWVHAERIVTLRSTQDYVPFDIDGRRFGSLGIDLMADFMPDFSEMPAGHLSREPYRLTGTRIGRLDEKSVREVLLGIAESFEPGRPTHGLPWPIAAPLTCARGADHLRAMAEIIGSGKLGTKETWEAAEQRWKSQHVRLEELVAGGEPWPHTIETHGFPFCVASKGISSLSRPEEIHYMVRFRNTLPMGSLRTWLGDWIIFASSYTSRSDAFAMLWPAATLLELVSDDFHRVFGIVDLSSDESSTLQLAELVGEHAQFTQMTVEAANRIVALGREHPHRYALIRLLAISGVLDVDDSTFMDRSRSLPQIEPSRFPARYRSAAVAVSLARGVGDEDIARELALSLEEADEVTLMVQRCAEFVERRGQFSLAEDRFFIQVERGVGRRDGPTRKTAIDALSKSARRAKSDLDRVEVWQKLALPPLVAQ